MRAALIAAETVWERAGREEGVTVTGGLEGTHSAGSLHYYGLALDFRTRYFNAREKRAAATELRAAIGGDFQVIEESTHIHVEPNDERAAELFALMGATF